MRQQRSLWQCQKKRSTSQQLGQSETVKPKTKQPTQSTGDFTCFIPETKDEEKKTPQETPTAKGAPVENKGKKSSLTKKSVQTTKNSTERVNGHDASAKKATTKKLPATGGEATSLNSWLTLDGRFRSVHDSKQEKRIIF